MDNTRTYNYQITEGNWDYPEDTQSQRIDHLEEIIIKAINIHGKRLKYKFNIRNLIEEQTLCLEDDIPQTYAKLKQITLDLIEVSNICKVKKLTINIPATLA